ncbi:serine/threonine-protein kinase [Kribbella sp. CA-293567]|uniref:serine/threonine-protein kinase n=1 Tax=Kribbella sp. CA-293567 TaxID=3002436 RepID=UPI0022DD23A1|nr:serine/threonine-protein kinase [Kribbella sp. CA-293567]WBQ04185.1 serine/threonine-protein kinase [Kribbella sp. CA-293567]
MRPPGAANVLLAERYRLGDPVGRGGMGVVYRATDELLGRDVAIKLLLPVRESVAAVERFQREARAAAMISDPHVVATYDFGPHGDGYFLAMELVEGTNVSVELKLRGPFASERALAIVRQAAAGLAAAHRHGLIHRDIKPANLLLTKDDLVKVADFGIVRILGDTTTTLTATGQIVGTSHYLAPERALGKPAEAASDVYALGCVLYQLVTGEPPFTAEDPASVMYQHVQSEATSPSELRPELAGDFEALLFWMLAKDPEARPTAEQVAAGATAPPLTRADAILPLPVRRRPSRRVLAATAAGLTLAAAGAVGILLDANSEKLPATNDLRPSVPAASAPAPTKPATVLPKATTSRSTGVLGTTRAATPDRSLRASTRTQAPKAVPSAKPTKTEKTKKPKPANTNGNNGNGNTGNGNGNGNGNAGNGNSKKG